MEYLIFKTNIKSRKKVEVLESVLSANKAIKYWSIDTTDVDSVLRIKALNGFSEVDVIEIVTQQGFYCEVLPD